jgi:hypothetical protein
MKTTKALFSELVYDFQSERWNESELPKLTLHMLGKCGDRVGYVHIKDVDEQLLRTSREAGWVRLKTSENLIHER